MNRIVSYSKTKLLLDRLGSDPAPAFLTGDGLDATRQLDDMAFPRDEYEERVDRARHAMEERGLGAVLVARPSSVEYLCGFHTSAAVMAPLLVSLDEVRLYLPDAEIGRAFASATVSSVAHYGSADDALRVIADDIGPRVRGAGPVGVEDLDASTPARLLARLRDSEVRTSAVDRLVERIRLCLSPREVECMEQAGRVTQAGIDAALEAAEVDGATDSGVAGAIADAIHRASNSSPAKPPVVATGRRGGVTHSTFRNLPLDDGLTFIEFAGSWARYNAPVMLTLARRSLDETEGRLERLATRMLRGVLEQARAGRAAGDVAAAVRAELDGELDENDLFHFNFGYPVGLAHPPTWMEVPDLSIMEGNPDALQAGMAFHVPASFRRFGELCVGLSHTIVIEESGARPLTGDGLDGVVQIGARGR